MPRFLIERELPSVGGLSVEAFQEIARRSCRVVRELGPDIQWIQSFVTDDKITCIYIAEDDAMIREHARLGGFPANRIARIRTIMDPTTAESAVLASRR